MGMQLHYRLYYDQLSLFDTGPWGILGHTLEARLSKSLGPNLEVRAHLPLLHAVSGELLVQHQHPDGR